MTLNIQSLLLVDAQTVVGQKLPIPYIEQITLETINVPDPPGYGRIEPHISLNKKKNLNLKTTLKIVLKDYNKRQHSVWFNSPLGASYRNKIKVAVVQTTTPVATAFWSSVRNAGDIPIPTLTNEAYVGTTVATFSLDELEGTQDPKLMKEKWFEKTGAGVNIYSFVKHLSFPSFQNIQGNDMKIYLSNEADHLAYFVYSYYDDAERGVPSAISRVNSDVVIQNKAVVQKAYVFHETSGRNIWTGPVHQMDDGRWMTGNAASSRDRYLTRRDTPNNKIIDYRLVEFLKTFPINFSILEEKILKESLGVVENIPTLSKPFDTNVVHRKYAAFSQSYLSRNKEGDCNFVFGVDMKKLMRENSSFGKLFERDSTAFKNYSKFFKITSFKVYRRRIETTSNNLIRKGFRDYSFSPPTKPKAFNVGGMAELGDIFEKEILVRGPNETPFKKMYNINRTRELIIDAPGGSTGDISNKAMGDGSSILKPFNPSYVQSQQDLDGIFYYIGSDKTIKDIGNGAFQYEIEIKVQDSLIDFVSAHKNSLIKNINYLSQLIDFVKMKNFNELNQKAKARPAKVEKFITNRYYDPVLDKFTYQFLNEVIGGKILNTLPSSFWQSIPQYYLTCLSLFADAPLEGELRVKVNQFLVNMLNPISSSITNYLIVRDILRDLVSDLELFLSGFSKDKIKKDERSQVEPSRAAGKKSINDNILTFNHVFEEAFDASINSNFGTYFLEPPSGFSAPSQGVRVISHEDFNNHKTVETRKIFNADNTDLNISAFPGGNTTLTETGYSYFTPSLVLNGEEDPLPITKDTLAVDLLDAEVDQLRAAKGQLTNSIQASSFTRDLNASIIDKGQKLNNKMADLFALTYGTVGLTEENSQQSSFGQEKGSTENELGGVIPTQQHKNAVQLKENNNISSIFRSLLSENIMRNEDKESDSIATAPYAKNSLSNFNPQILATKPDISDDFIRQLPNQLKALVAAQDTENKTGTSPINLLNAETQALLTGDPFQDNELFIKAKYLFENIVAVEVLTGYETVQFGTITERCIKAPIWELLTPEIYGRAVGSNTSLMCRLVPYHNSTLGVAYNKEENFPILDEYFLIGSATNKPVIFNKEVPPGTPQLSLMFTNPSYQSSNFQALDKKISIAFPRSPFGKQGLPSAGGNIGFPTGGGGATY
tara:strand:+ start:11143 stop:14646 length:3504 start_codon:yes stop_codon:yes gene_type:complete